MLEIDFCLVRSKQAFDSNELADVLMAPRQETSIRAQDMRKKKVTFDWLHTASLGQACSLSIRRNPIRFSPAGAFVKLDGNDHGGSVMKRLPTPFPRMTLQQEGYEKTPDTFFPPG